VLVGELIAGAIIGRTGLHLIHPSEQPFPVFLSLGFAMLMLGAGTEVDLASKDLRNSSLRGGLALLAALLVSIPLGIAFSALLRTGHPQLLIVLLAGCSAAVAFPTIQERGLTGPAIAQIIAWMTLADAVTALLMPLTLSVASHIPAALLGDVLIDATTALTLSVISSSGAVRVTSTGAIRDGNGAALNVTAAGNSVLQAGGILGTFADPLEVNIGGSLGIRADGAEIGEKVDRPAQSGQRVPAPPFWRGIDPGLDVAPVHLEERPEIGEQAPPIWHRAAAQMGRQRHRPAKALGQEFLAEKPADPHRLRSLERQLVEGRHHRRRRDGADPTLQGSAAPPVVRAQKCSSQ